MELHNWLRLSNSYFLTYIKQEKKVLAMSLDNVDWKICEFDNDKQIDALIGILEQLKKQKL